METGCRLPEDSPHGRFATEDLPQRRFATLGKLGSGGWGQELGVGGVGVGGWVGRGIGVGVEGGYGQGGWGRGAEFLDPPTPTFTSPNLPILTPNPPAHPPTYHRCVANLPHRHCCKRLSDAYAQILGHIRISPAVWRIFFVANLLWRIFHVANPLATVLYGTGKNYSRGGAMTLFLHVTSSCNLP